MAFKNVCQKVWSMLSPTNYLLEKRILVWFGTLNEGEYFFSLPILLIPDALTCLANRPWRTSLKNLFSLFSLYPRCSMIVVLSNVWKVTIVFFSIFIILFFSFFFLSHQITSVWRAVGKKKEKKTSVVFLLYTVVPSSGNFIGKGLNN